MKKLVLLSCLFLSLTSVTSQTFTTEKKTDSQGYTYETVKNDKTGVRIYTLKNGLKVYLAQNTDEPKYAKIESHQNNQKNDCSKFTHIY